MTSSLIMYFQCSCSSTFLPCGGGREFVVTDDVNHLESKTCVKLAATKKKGTFTFTIKAQEESILLGRKQYLLFLRKR